MVVASPAVHAPMTMLGEPVMLTDAKVAMRQVIEQSLTDWVKDSQGDRERLAARLDGVLGKLFADTASVLATPMQDVAPWPEPRERTTTENNDVVLSLVEAMAEQSRTIAAQADEIVSLARLVKGVA
jgi:hypothetical protein